MAAIQYNGILRKIIVSFGGIFNNIQIARFNTDGTEQERFLVPVAYAGKEKYVVRMQGDPDLDRSAQLSLPNMSYEMTGLTYDASRKLNTLNKTFGQTPTGVKSQWNPVPYDIDFSAYIFVRNIEDGTQIIERIVPHFTPDYTLRVNLIPELGIIKDIPIHLKSVTNEVEYTGQFNSEIRSIIWTLNFTAKAFLYGPTSNSGLITTSITNIFEDISLGENVLTFNMSAGVGNYIVGESVYQGAAHDLNLAMGVVSSWNPTSNVLILSEASGNFIVNQVLYGKNSLTNRTITSYSIAPKKDVTITVVPNPITANANSSYTYTTTISETGA